MTNLLNPQGRFQKLLNENVKDKSYAVPNFKIFIRNI